MKALASVYSAAASTKSYIQELQTVSRLIGKPFAEVLQEELATLTEPNMPPLHETPSLRSNAGSEQVGSTSPQTHDNEPPVQSAPLETPNLTKSTPTAVTQPSMTTMPAPITISNVTPADVQRVIVEHIVRNEEAKSYSDTPTRLRAFSGKSPRPNNESDFK